MDAMLSAQDVEQGFSNVSKIFKEMVRVMSVESKFMVVSHIEAESCEFHELMQEVILPALDTKRTVLWDIEAHVVKAGSSSASAGKTEGGEELNEGRGTVYVVSSRRRKFTRNMLQSGAPVDFKVLQYDSSDDDEEEEDDEE